MDLFSAFATGQRIIVLAIWAGSVFAAVLALLHAVVQRPDAFTAVDRQSKLIWVSILGAATIVMTFFGVLSAGITGILALAGLVAVLVYLVDVRKRVDDVQGRSWFRKK
ncbi:MAG: DUF2516 family protein [Gordonia sp. (in: high G+C Gram-positive bacteria)]